MPSRSASGTTSSCRAATARDPFIPWGTPILGGFPAFQPGANTAAEQAQQIGMHHDGMHYFPLGKGSHGSRRGLLVLNHEYTDERYLHTGTTTMPPVAEWTLEMVRKSQNAHGVAVVEIAKGHKGWEVVRSKLNRRITANTTMAVSGPAAGHRLLRTSADPSGRRPLGTFNNCAHGHTPWATYLTCEENFHGYFRLEPGSYEDGAEGSDPGTAAVLAQQRADALERPGRDREVGERPALLALDDARLEQLLEVVADRRLLERKQVFEVADAHGLAPGLEQAVEDLDAVAVGERLEHALELAGLVLGQARLGERGAALDEGESAHVLHHIEES